MKKNGLKIKPNIADPKISEVHYNGKHLGDINLFENVWWWRVPNAIMWWRCSNFDEGTELILSHSGI